MSTKRCSAFIPGRPDVIRNTLAIAEQCNFKLGRVDSLPAFDVPAGYTIESYFEKVTRDGFADRLTTIAPLAEAGRLRYPIDAYKDRLDRELSVIKRVGFAGYFLIVWDFIRYARERRIPVGPGRGSAAGSLVAYCLRITDIDPIEYDLIFERFLNEERISPPDIDIDFCESRRGEVIEYVTRKYGRENVAQIITFGTMKARAVVRDVGRVLDMSYADVDKVAKMIPPDLKMTLDKALEESPPLKSAYLQDLKVKELIDISRRLEGTTRHASTHAAGVVISPQPLMDLVPLFKGTTADITTQFDMKGVERIGLLKMDFLGLRTLTLIDNCIKMVEAELGERIDLDTLPLDDARTYELFSQGRTAGLFQFESEGMRDILKRFRPDRLEHLTALNALYRPGPMQMIEDFIKRRHGQTRVTFEVAAMKPILEGTYGVMVYQEQVMQIASALAGFSLGEADILRKAMGKKKADVMGAQMEKFTSGCVARGVPAAKAKRIWDQMETFAGYGFNKSHSAAYAYLAYQTAYLKANYPVFFMAALLTSERANTEKMVAYIGECRDMEIKVRPPDVNESHSFFTVVLRPESATADAPSETPPARPIRRGDIRFGLSAIKNVGEGAVDAILEARKEALFGSLFDFCGRVDLRAVNRRVIESFIKSGCFDSLDHRRASLFASIDRAMEIGQKRQRDREQGQGSLFGLMDMGGGASGGTAPAAADRVPDMPEWHESERLAFEKESLGYFITGHPLDRYREDLAQWGMNSARLAKISEAMDVAIGGLITALRQIKTKKGDWMATFILEDLEGTVEVIVFTEAYKRLSGVLADDLIALVRGKAEPLEEGRVRLLAQEVVPLEEAKMKEARQVVIRMTAAEWGQVSGEKLRDILAAHAGDCPVGLELEGNDRQVVRLAFGNRYRVRPEAALKKAIEELIGSERVTFQRNGGALARPMNGSRAQDGATPQSAVARDEEA
ncbi:MAG: DNA polymerase III subunit alpha [Vicinamibacteria bacterium]|nr:DNA polymerase III subunit alpha [Vicinamibacteria bacterium]